MIKNNKIEIFSRKEVSKIESVFYKIRSNAILLKEKALELWNKIPKPIRNIIKAIIEYKIRIFCSNFISDEASGWFEEK